MKITEKNGKITIFKKSQKSWAEIIKDMPTFPDFDVGRKECSIKTNGNKSKSE
jgi:hypothetical protein